MIPLIYLFRLRVNGDTIGGACKEKCMAKKVKLTKGEQRSLRIQQVIFMSISVIILLAMVLSLVR